MLAGLLAITVLQPAAVDTPAQMLTSVALCVAALEYPGVYPDADEARAAWRHTLTLAPGSDAASQEAAVAAGTAQLESTGADAGSDGAEVARAVGILAPNCLTVEGAERAAVRLTAEAAQ